MQNTEAQIRYLVQWFGEWSELQRSDFLPIMAEKYAGRVYVNGIVNSIAGVHCREKPMSLFECRVKLFREWFAQWSAEQQDNFLKQITDLDAAFADKLDAEMHNNIDDHRQLNGDAELGLED